MDNIKLTCYNPILLMHGIKTKNLWTNPYQKDLFLKSLYETAKKNEFSWEHFQFMAKKLEISTSTYIKLLEEYIETRIPEEIRPSIKYIGGQYVLVKKEKSSLERLYDKLITLRTSKEIVAFFEKNKLYKDKIYNDYYHYKELYTSDQYRTIINNIIINSTEETKRKEELEKKERLEQRLFEKKNETKAINNVKKEVYVPVKSNEEIQKEEKEKLKKAKEIVKLVIDSNTYHIMHLLKEHGEDKNSFKKKLNLVKEAESKKEEEKEGLYRKFSGKRLRIINAVIAAMRLAQEENRKFDLIDYQAITDIEPGELAYYTTGSKSLLLKKFSSANFLAFRDEEKFEENVFKDQIIFNAEYDKQNNYIEGSGRILTDEEKQSFINFLEYCKMYKNQYTFLVIKNRFRKGIETKSKDKKLVIKPLNGTNND